jgi:transposase InsO family protein
MSRKGNCWDNAVVEGFFNSRKMERVYRSTRVEPAIALARDLDVPLPGLEPGRVHGLAGLDHGQAHRVLMNCPGLRRYVEEGVRALASTASREHLSIYLAELGEDRGPHRLRASRG